MKEFFVEIVKSLRKVIKVFYKEIYLGLKKYHQ